MSSRAPLIVAIVLLLLPVVYVVSYLTLVAPRSVVVSPRGVLVMSNYRVGHRIAPIVFLPLEQIDRKLRPQVWNPTEELIGRMTHRFRDLVPDEDLPRIFDALEKNMIPPTSKVSP